MNSLFCVIELAIVCTYNAHQVLYLLLCFCARYDTQLAVCQMIRRPQFWVLYYAVHMVCTVEQRKLGSKRAHKLSVHSMGAANWGFEWLGWVGTRAQIRVSNGALPEWVRAFLAHFLLSSQLRTRRYNILCSHTEVPQQTLLNTKMFQGGMRWVFFRPLFGPKCIIRLQWSIWTLSSVETLARFLLLIWCISHQENP